MNVCGSLRLSSRSLYVPDLRPLTTCGDSTVMLPASLVVEDMVRNSPTLHTDTFLGKEVGQALVMIDGTFIGEEYYWKGADEVL